MTDETRDAMKTYKVLINAEEQYSLWPARKAIPAGWREVGPTGSKAECLEYVEKVWTDITPLTVRRRMAGRSMDPAT
jgi:MbtH protein